MGKGQGGACLFDDSDNGGGDSDNGGGDGGDGGGDGGGGVGVMMVVVW